MQSLYDSLSLPNPTAPAAPVQPWPEKLTGQQFAELVVSSLEFRQYILIGLCGGEIPSAVVKQLMDYAWGKPVDRVEVKDTTLRLETLSVEELEERALQLAELARQLRSGVTTPSNTDSIH